ncbi:MAG TPA: response regulator, partial [Flavisolibacter sp.]|nr:response regulator [Flavisolibacter sp.]
MILIIDDDIAVRTALLLLLQNEGYEVRSADEPAKAMALVKQQAPRLIILDLNFSIDTSGKEGMQLLGEIKNFNDKIPVILITGWGTIELAVQGMKLGANDFLNKPWSNDHVLASVKTLLQLKEKKTEKHG